MPKKYWSSLEELFPSLGTSDRRGGWDSAQEAEYIDRLIAEGEARGLQGVGDEGAAAVMHQHVGIARKAEAAISLGEDALRLNADTRIVEQLGRAILELVMDTGTLSITSRIEALDVMERVLSRGVRLVDAAKNQREIDPRTAPAMPWYDLGEFDTEEEKKEGDGVG